MKKKLVSALLCMAMLAAVAGCGGKSEDAATSGDSGSGKEADSSADSDKNYAIVTKSAGNPYNEKQAVGFQETIEAAGGTCIVKHPQSATAEDQITMINELVAQGVDSIAIAGNDYDALQPALAAAVQKGIQVSSFDANVNPDSRAVFVNQAGVTQIGETLMDAILDITGGEGEWAILSATANATNQNAWIEAMKTAMTNEKYAKLQLVEVAYGDDEYQKSTDQTQALLQKYPNLKVICAPTTVGIMAAAKVLQDEKSAVKLTGLGLPSEMAEYIGDGDDKACPYMYLWNPIDVGRLSAYVSMALVDGTITGKAGDKFTAGELGDYEIVEAADGGTEVIVGPPFKFDSSNIEEWKGIY
jgi:rhamnose transport system substrate-binding protein